MLDVLHICLKFVSPANKKGDHKCIEYPQLTQMMHSPSPYINVKTYANTGQIAFDMINAWNNFEDPIKYITYHNPLKSKKFRISTVKKRIKTYLHSISSFTCMKKECHACLRTPNIQQLSNYTSKT